MIPLQSRYFMQGATVVRLPTSSGAYQLSVIRTVPPVNVNFFLYVWQQTDRPDTVAKKFLNDPTLWWSIFDLNPEIIYPLNIPVGTVIRIPTSPIAGQGTLLQ